MELISKWAKTIFGGPMIMMGISDGGYATAIAYEQGVCNIAMPSLGCDDWFAQNKYEKRKGHAGRCQEQSVGTVHAQYVLNKIKASKIPILIIAGAKDSVCIQEQSHHFFLTLLKKGTPVAYCVFKNLGHEDSNDILEPGEFL